MATATRWTRQVSAGVQFDGGEGVNGSVKEKRVHAEFRVPSSMIAIAHG
jgi:hypothetical protein